MTQSNDFKDNIVEKWKPILETLGVTGSRSNWMSQLIENQTQPNQSKNISETSNSFGSLLPISMRIASQTIANNLVSVQPMGGPSTEELEKIKKEVKSTNRDRIIDSVIEDKEYKEMKVEDHPDFKKDPKGELFYLDYLYNPTQSSSKTKKRK